MNSDSYGERLDEMIELFQNYKSGSVKLDNITKLCQTLGLESFIEDIGSETSRLSTASKIIVIDIDFARSQGKVTDVKLVLASNFDNFNYFIDQPSPSTNILLNSLTQYPDLHEFHHNLKFLHLLDTFSNIDIDASNSGNNVGTVGISNSTTANNGNGSNHNTYSGKLDLFKYYTELAQFIRHYFAAQSAPFKVQTNLNNRFGIYLSALEGQIPIAKIYLEKSKDAQQRLYEFVYSEGNKDWINESPESYTCGVSLVMEIEADYFSTWFPKDFIPQELIQESVSFHDIDDLKSSNRYDLNDLIQGSKSSANCNNKIEIVNDFTTKLVVLKKFNISNDNLNLILEVLNWVRWSQTVLHPVYSLLIGTTDNQATNEGEDKAEDEKISSFLSGGLRGRRSSGSTSYRRRRFSNKNRRPSIAEAAMLKDEGFQQFNLHEIMTGPSEDLAAGQQALEPDMVIGSAAQKDQMDVDQAVDDDDNLLQLIISEDHICLGDIARCTLYEGADRWSSFIEVLKKHTV